jgi:hypothetical protein
MEGKIKELYEFLEKNRKYNKKVQEGFIKSCIAIDGLTTEQKVLNLLYGVVNTQSQPKIDKIGPFFTKMYQKDSDLTSYKGFLKTLKNESVSSDSLFELMKSQNGWGSKTAALFVKTIYLIYNDTTYEDYMFWENSIPTNLKLKLPVDAVITHIFKEYFHDNNYKSDFDGINEFFSKKHTENDDFIIWDELWFWGFITQKIENNKRVSNKFNENKFWCLPYIEKDIDEIKEKAKEFLNILKK